MMHTVKVILIGFALLAAGLTAASGRHMMLVAAIHA
jgi:hypothetical protein